MIAGCYTIICYHILSNINLGCHPWTGKPYLAICKSWNGMTEGFTHQVVKLADIQVEQCAFWWGRLKPPTCITRSKHHKHAFFPGCEQQTANQKRSDSRANRHLFHYFSLTTNADVPTWASVVAPQNLDSVLTKVMCTAVAFVDFHTSCHVTSSVASKEWGMSPMMQRYMKSQTTSGAQDSAFAIGSRNQAHSNHSNPCSVAFQPFVEPAII